MNSPEPESQRTQRNNIVVLVVDKNPQRRNSATEALSAPLMQVMTAASGLEALEMLSQQIIDIVVAGHELEDMRGCDFIAELVREDGATDVPTLLVVNQGDTSALNDGFLAGATSFAFRETDWISIGYQIMYVLRANLIAFARATNEPLPS